VAKTYTVTYNFHQDQTLVDIATASAVDGYSLTLWDFTDLAGNPQGVTIYEQGAIGGPWSTICSPLLIDAEGPISLGGALFSDGTNMIVKIAPKFVPVVSGLVTGYEIRAFTSSGQIYGIKIPNQDQVVFSQVIDLTITKIEIRTLVNQSPIDPTKESISRPAFVKLDNLKELGTQENIVPSELRASTAFVGDVATITILGANPNYPIIYTLDQTDPSDPSVSKIIPSATSKLYVGPIVTTVRTSVFLRAKQFGNSVLEVQINNPNPNRITNVPQNLVATPINNAIKLSWDPPAINVNTFLQAAGFRVNYYNNLAPEILLVLHN
jgi:hypothetical protein